MDKRTTEGRLVFEEFTPSHKWVQEEGFDTLIVELPEFKKEQIRVQLEKFGRLNISGERPLGPTRWSRFHIDVQVPKRCKEIHTKFENERLNVKILPKSSKSMQVLANVIVGVVVLVLMVAYMTYKN